jgi:outer membrane protein assembly factor BamA
VRRARRVVASTFFVGAIALAGNASAEDDVYPDDEDADAQRAPSPILVGPREDESHATVDDAEQARVYDEEPPLDAADVALLFPRLLLAPARWIFTGLFWPFEQTMAMLEKYAILDWYKEIFYNAEETASIVPTLSISLSNGFTLGAKAEHTDLLGNDEVALLSAKYGGRFSQAYEASFKADHLMGSPIWLEAITVFDAERNSRFFGYGDNDINGVGSDPTVRATDTRFQQQRALIKGHLGWTFGRHSREVKLGWEGRYVNASFDSAPDGVVSIEDVFDTSQVTAFDNGYRIFETGVNFIVDTRDVHGATTSGLYLDSFVTRTPQLNDFNYFHWGVAATGYIPLYRRTVRLSDARVLAIRAVVESAEGDLDEIPFTELPRLGGSNMLRGYVSGRFRDKHLWVATAEYRYPISEMVGGSIFVDVGDVYGSYSDWFGEAPEVGGGFGFVVRDEDSQMFALDFAYGDSFQVYFTTDPLRAFDGRGLDL